jgi:hypothetical protein
MELRKSETRGQKLRHAHTQAKWKYINKII